MRLFLGYLAHQSWSYGGSQTIHAFCSLTSYRFEVSNENGTNYTLGTTGLYSEYVTDKSAINTFIMIVKPRLRKIFATGACAAFPCRFSVLTLSPIDARSFSHRIVRARVNNVQLVLTFTIHQLHKVFRKIFRGPRLPQFLTAAVKRCRRKTRALRTQKTLFLRVTLPLQRYWLLGK